MGVSLPAPDRRLLWAGVVLSLCLITEVALLLLLDSRAAWGLLGSIGLEFVTGREAAFPVALAAGASPLWVAVASVFQNLAVAALGVPWLGRLVDRWESHDHFLARRLRRLQRAVQTQRRGAARWGPIGLFAFMLLPFQANGALVSASLARLIGLRHRETAAAVASATILVSFAWAYLLDSLVGWSRGFDSRLPDLLAAGAVLTIVGWALVDEWRERRPVAR